MKENMHCVNPVEYPQCDGEMHTQTKKGGETPLVYVVHESERIIEIPNGKCLLRTRCIDCGEISGEFESLPELIKHGKKYCNLCKKKRKYKQVSKWKTKNPDKVAEYQKLKNIRRCLREGKEPRTLIHKCQLCGNDISDKPNALYCNECRTEIRSFRDWYHAEEICGREIVKKSLITHCIVCGRNISMYSSQAIYCTSCKPKWDDIDKLGTTNISYRMKRLGSGKPDFKSELRNIESHMKSLGLKPIKKEGGK